MAKKLRNTPIKKFNDHKAMAKRRGINFLLTFEEWWDIWEKSGKWDQRGRKRGQFVMSRNNDIGAYEIGNVLIQSQDKNMSQAQTGKKHTITHIEKVRQASFNSWQYRKQQKELTNG